MALQDKSRVSFSWDIHYKCNYRCPYCWWHGRWQDLSKFNKYPAIKELVGYWTNIYRKYGPAHIEVLGGEPFIYPGFNELISELSKMHTLGITTNLSVDIGDFSCRIDPGRVKVMPTFHPYSADFDSFLIKALLLKQKGFSESVYYLAYPPQIKFINFYREKFTASGINFLVTTFWGRYNDTEYPAGYKDEEKAAIEGVLARRCNEEYQVTPKKDFKGKLCNAGRYYGGIHPDGKVVRCGGSGLDEAVGNFFDDNFALFDKPLPCAADSCKCNEWAFLLEKDASAGKQNHERQ
ncbi:MAG: hypothetical protein WC312_02815 [Candidatus Omnitrophota bacterium]